MAFIVATHPEYEGINLYTAEPFSNLDDAVDWLCENRDRSTYLDDEYEIWEITETKVEQVEYTCE